MGVRMDKLLETVLAIVDRSGVRWLVASIGIVTIGYLSLQGLSTIQDVVGICVIMVTYFIFRHHEHKQNLTPNNGE